MNIIVIGSVRTKSTAVADTLALKYADHKYWREYFYKFTLKFKSIPKPQLDNVVKRKIIKFNEEINSTNKNIIKILGSNLHGIFKYIHLFELEKYDQIYLTERHNFFDQVCSDYVANNMRIWNSTENEFIQKKYSLIQDKKFSIDKFRILSTAFDVCNYIQIKQFIIENNLKYNLKLYHDTKLYDNIITKPTNLNYENIIVNYNLKNTINDLFSQCFNYQNCKSDYNTFSTLINQIEL